LKSFLAVSKQFTNLINTSFSIRQNPNQADIGALAVAYILFFFYIYLFIIERCTEGKLITQWAKNLVTE